MPTILGVRARVALVSAVALLVTPSVAFAHRHGRVVTVMTPASHDFTLATATVRWPATGLRVSISSPTGGLYVASAAVRSHGPLGAVVPPHLKREHVFVVIVNRQPPDAMSHTPKTVTLRVRAHSPMPVPSVSEHVNILADGARGQDCNALTYYAALRHAYMWGYELRPLVGPRGFSETVAQAVDQACSDSIDTQFERWVLGEPPPPHP